MISDATDYQYISPVGLINGGILPARDVAADGSSLTVRAEDVDFALEAAHERSHIYRAPSDLPPSLPSPTILVKPTISPSSPIPSVQNAWSVIGGYVYRDTKVLPGEGTDTTPVACIDPMATFPDIEPVEYNYNPDIWYSGNPSFIALYPNTRIFSGFYQADYGQRVLDYDYLRHFYYSLQRAERLWLDGYASSVCKSFGTLSGTDTREHPYTNTYDGTNDFTLVSSASGISYRYVGDDTYQRYTYGVTSASMKCIPSMSSCVAAAKVIALYHIRIYHTELVKHYYYTKVYDCSINSGIEIPAAFVIDPLAVANEIGVPFPATVSGDYRVLEVTRLAMYFVAWYDFNTEIRSLNWQWTP